MGKWDSRYLCYATCLPLARFAGGSVKWSSRQRCKLAYGYCVASNTKPCYKSLATMKSLSGQFCCPVAASRIVTLLVLIITGRTSPSCISTYLDKAVIGVVGSKIVVSMACWITTATPTLDCPFPIFS